MGQFHDQCTLSKALVRAVGLVVSVQANEKLVANAKRIIRRLVKHDLYHQLEVANSRLGSDMLGKTMAQKKKERLNLRSGSIGSNRCSSVKH